MVRTAYLPLFRVNYPRKSFLVQLRAIFKFRQLFKCFKQLYLTCEAIEIQAYLIKRIELTGLGATYQYYQQYNDNNSLQKTSYS